jgi:hypothetical protein
MTEVGPPLGKAKERLAANAVQDCSNCEKQQLVQGYTHKYSTFKIAKARPSIDLCCV